MMSYQQNYQYQPVSPVYYAPMPINPGMHGQTQNMLSKAGEIAVSIFSELKSQEVPQAYAPRPRPMRQPGFFDGFGRLFSTTPSIYVDNSHREINIGSSKTVVVNSSPRDRRKEQENSEMAMRALAGIVGAIILGVGAYLSGGFFAKYQEAKENADEFQRLNATWTNHRASYQAYAPVYEQKVTQVVDKVQAILERRSSNRMWNVALSVSSIATGALLVAGAICALPELMTVGLITGLSTGAIALAKYGYQSHDKRDKRDANEIYSRLTELSSLEQQAYAASPAPSAPGMGV